MAASCLPAVLALASAAGATPAQPEGEEEPEGVSQLDAQALPTAAHFEAVAADLAAAQSAVLPEVLLKLLTAVAAAALGKVCFPVSLSAVFEDRAQALNPVCLCR